MILFVNKCYNIEQDIVHVSLSILMHSSKYEYMLA